ncbi:MAG: hypothetical protein ACFFDO_06870 [Candidatus Thorarchaeota archaeon]
MKKSELYKGGGKWDLLIALRLYIIVFLIIYPLIYIVILLGYLSPIGILILGISIWLILKYVLFESRKRSIRFIKTLYIIVGIIYINFVLSLIINIIHTNLANILLSLCICLGSAIFFLVIVLRKPFRIINSSLTLKKLEWSKRIKKSNFWRKIFSHSLIFWLLISINLLFLPYPVYIQQYTTSNYIIRQNTSPITEFGIWTYGQSLDDEKKGDPEYVDNKTLKLLGDAGIYFIYGINKPNFDSKFLSRIRRCKQFGIEVHLSIGPKDWSYANIWSFKDLKDEIEEILTSCKAYNLLGDPITTIVYDMETLVDTPFPLYGFNLDYIDKLKEYYKIQKKFIKFNDFIKIEYDLDIRITTDIFQGVDFNDGDDDLKILWGLIDDANADMSYMVYRRNTFGQNQILDHFRFLKDGDTIILNAWKHQGYLCWGDIHCAIRDCRLVLGYPKKTFRLEIWELYHFLGTYGDEGLENLVEAICEVDSSEWPSIIVSNNFPFSFYWDIVFIGIIMIDLYSSLFRILYSAY